MQQVLFVFGGQSSEHGVSCLTAAQVVASLDTSMFEAHLVGITTSGKWVRYSPDEVKAFEIFDNKLPAVDDTRQDALLYRSSQGVRLATLVEDELIDVVGVDAAFALLHGAFGEDGTIQGQFEMLGLPYVGNGVAASANGMDKQWMKIMLEAADIPVGPYVTLTKKQWDANPEAWLETISELEYPLYVKPARGGSSMGISRVDEEGAVVGAIEEAAKFDPKIIVEQGIVGAREIECAVLDGAGGAMASQLGEIIVHEEDEFYDFNAKYLGAGQVELKAPAELPSSLEDRIRNLAIQAFEALGCEGLVRVDTFVVADEVLINEVNTMPGFTKISMFPHLWSISGMDYSQLITYLIEDAFRRGVGLR